MLPSLGARRLKAALRSLTRRVRPRTGDPAPDPAVLRRALVERYASAPAPSQSFPLHGTPGCVAVDEGGLVLHVGEGPPDFRRVPWADVRHLLPVQGGGVHIHVAHVGVVKATGRVAGEALRARGPAPR